MTPVIPTLHDEAVGAETELQVDVLVVGAGPVGLTAAALLAAVGVKVAVVERNQGTSDEPKAISIDDESLRTFASAGLIEAILPIITPGTGTRYYGADGVAVFQARAAVPFRLGYPFKNPFAQPDLERALGAAAAANPRVQLLFETEFAELTQDADSVNAIVHDLANRTSRKVHCAYVLGCDGGRSTVRELLGVEMSGRSYSEVWLVADTLNDPHRERFGMHHGDPDRPFVIIPGRGGRCRYEFLLHPGEGEAGETVAFELIQRLLANHRQITPKDVERAVNYRFHGLVADKWFQGRTFLLGDAAHMMPPFAGQGLNSGIRDAANLTWKIADVLKHRLAPEALTTYEGERKEHSAATVRVSERLGRVVMSTNPRLAARRDADVRQAMDTRDGRAYFEEMKYRPIPDLSSGLCVVDDGEAAGQMLGQPRAFDITSHREMLLDELIGNGWALLGVDVSENDWERALPAGVATLLPRRVTISVDDFLPANSNQRPIGVDIDGSLERELAHLHGRFALVRPDKFVAATWAPGDIDRVAHGLSAFIASPRSVSQPEEV